MAESRVLVVEDELVNAKVLGEILRASGYDAAVAEDGFDALLNIAEQKPDLVLTDLQMPRMSGFELLSVVRRRFPEIAVIAMSGAYEPAGLPACVLCDAFFTKGSYKPPQLLEKIAELLSGDQRAPLPKDVLAPVWLPRGIDNYYIVTCTDCLRSFPVKGTTTEQNAEQHTSCIHCGVGLRYFIEGEKV